ncbi:MAG: class I SAM-dependent methyltransferase [Planctomycetota bacterium]
MKPADERTARFWEASHAADCAADAFLEHPVIQAYLSLRAYGSTRAHLDVAIDELRQRTAPGARILSVGCGAANKERVICRALPDRQMFGVDVARQTLARTAEECRAEGIDNLTLDYGDFNALDLEPASFDAILGLGAIHHVENLESFWTQCRSALRPAGFVLAQEYVGPSRFQWTDAQIAHGNRVLADLVPRALQVHHTEVQRVVLAEIIAADPSEAVRSEELLSTCTAAGLRLDAHHGAGCGLLLPVLWDQVHAFDPHDWDHNHVLFQLFAAEAQLIDDGVVGDCYAMFSAVPA